MTEKLTRLDRWKVVPLLITATWLSTLVLLIYFGFFYADPPAKIKSVEVVFGETVPGGQYIYELDWCMLVKASSVEISTIWVDSLIFSEPHRHSPAPPKDCYTSRIQNHVPENLPPGEYMLDLDLSFQVRPLISRSIEYQVGPIIVREVTNE